MSGSVGDDQEGPEGQLSAERDFLRAVLENLDDGVVACDADGVLTLFNEATRRFHGLPEAPLGPGEWAEHYDLFLPDHVTPMSVEDVPLFRALSGEIVRKADMVIAPKNGRRRLVQVSGRAIYGEDGSKIGAVVVMHDTTDRREVEQKLSRQAFSDALTGLGNRAGLTVHLQEAIRRGASTGAPVAVLIVDLDDFKKVNDSFGHAAGDLLLIEVAHRLRACLRGPDAAVRLGGDEFALVLEETDEEQAILVAERVLAATRKAFSLEDSEIVVNASIGIALSRGKREGGDSLLRAADLAMYVAKSRGKGGFAVFEQTMQLAALGRLSLEADLRRALARGELTLAYQPVVSLSNGSMVGVEALLRWVPPGKKPIRPEEFIPVAEDSGLIVPIGAWVLQEACAQVRQWDAAHPDRPRLTVAVNVSARQLQRYGLTKTVVEVLERTALEPDRLVLELTESVLGDDEVLLATLREIELLGVKLSIDDFGTGYSSLSRLRTLPIAAVKIDKSFVDDIGAAGGAAPLVAATLAMAKGLGLSVVAEGIETVEQLEFLRHNGCGEGQGFLMSRPVDHVVIGVLLERGESLFAIDERTESLEIHADRELMDAIEAVVATNDDEEKAIRPLLAELARITGLQSTYLTQIHRDRSEQEILYARNTGELNIPEGLKVDWADTLCRQALLGGPSNTDEVPLTYPDSQAAQHMGLQTYVSVPVPGRDGRIFGTLCGASPKREKLAETEMAIVHLFARLIADQLARGSAESGPESP